MLGKLQKLPSAAETKKPESPRVGHFIAQLPGLPIPSVEAVGMAADHDSISDDKPLKPLNVISISRSSKVTIMQKCAPSEEAEGGVRFPSQRCTRQACLTLTRS